LLHAAGQLAGRSIFERIEGGCPQELVDARATLGSIAALAWTRLETAAQAAMTNGHANPSMQLVADTRGITALIKDEHGVTVTLQGGKVSVAVDSAQEGTE
jgi:hypothetical protein